MSEHIATKLAAFLRDKERKPVWKVGLETLSTLLQEGECAHYFTRLLYKPWVDNPLDYMGNRRIKRIWAAYKHRSWNPYLSHKLLFHCTMSAAGLPTPELFGYNICDTFIFSGETKTIGTFSEFKSIMERLLAASSNHAIFMKPVDASQGFGCLRVRSPEQVDADIFTMVRGRSYLMQETLVQHPGLACIHAGALSTFRIDTFRTADNEILLLGSYLRFGSGEKCVDNINSGGLFVGVDLDSGRLKPRGLRDICYGAQSHTTHPDSGFVFEDYTVPCFGEVKALVQSAAEVVPYKLIGWDVALTERGPVLIEANTGYGIAASEMGYGGYYSNPRFLPVLREAGLTNPRQGTRGLS